MVAYLPWKRGRWRCPSRQICSSGCSNISGTLHICNIPKTDNLTFTPALLWFASCAEAIKWRRIWTSLCSSLFIWKSFRLVFLTISVFSQVNNQVKLRERLPRESCYCYILTLSCPHCILIDADWQCVLLAEATESHTRWTSVQNLKNLEKVLLEQWFTSDSNKPVCELYIFLDCSWQLTGWNLFIYLFIFDRWRDRLCTTFGFISSTTSSSTLPATDSLGLRTGRSKHLHLLWNWKFALLMWVL